MPDPNSSVTTMRLNKRMAALGLCSRREADAWIAEGWVRVNGKPASIGQPVSERDAIEVTAAANRAKDRQVTIILNKPLGYVSGQAEDGHPCASSLVRADTHWPDDPAKRRFETSHAHSLAVAGRLDIDSTGLLVLTQDGRIARALIGEDTSIEKEYLVRVMPLDAPPGTTERARALVPPETLDPLRHGLTLDDKPLKTALVEWQNDDQLRFVLREGKKRQIRRMCEKVGLKVTGLKRVRIGAIMLGHLPTGQWRYLQPREWSAENTSIISSSSR